MAFYWFQDKNPELLADIKEKPEAIFWEDHQSHISAPQDFTRVCAKW